MNDTEVKPKLSKHVTTAVNALEKQIEVYDKKLLKLQAKMIIQENQCELLKESISGLRDQILKLQEG